MADVWSEVREDFPATARRAYLNAAAASPVPRPVAEAVAGWYRQLAEGGDEQWDAWLERREQVRSAVARFVNADTDEVAFVPNTSTGINVVADLLAGDGPVLTSELEFPTLTLPWIHRGTSTVFLPARDGVLAAADFAAGAPRATTLVVSHVQFSNGCRQDLAELGRLKGSRALVVCGSQSTGALDVDVATAGIDAFVTSGHKWLCAGYGAGFLVVRRALLERRPHSIGWLSCVDPFAFDNRSYRLLPSARRFETGCPSFASLFALGAAVAYLSSLGMAAIESRVLCLNEQLTDALARARFPVLSPLGSHRSGQTLVEVPDPPRAVAFLAERGVMVTPKPQGLRISTHVYNDETDIARAVAALLDYRRAAT
jgi:selenocysteine lyase/cysteine desulfurase